MDKKKSFPKVKLLSKLFNVKDKNVTLRNGVFLVYRSRNDAGSEGGGAEDPGGATGGGGAAGLVGRPPRGGPPPVSCPFGAFNLAPPTGSAAYTIESV